MRDTLCDHLGCPDCRRVLVLEVTERDGEEILAGTLGCAACGHARNMLQSGL